MPERHAEVLIAGAGPVGCTAALALARAGVSVIMVEGCDTLPLELRASTFHPPTLDLLEDPDETERELLGQFPYQANSVLLHTDPSVLPRNRRTWASWNVHAPPVDQDSVRITYNMNILQKIPGPHVFNVTLNDQGSIPAYKILGRYTYRHPQYGPGSERVQSRHRELIGRRRTSFCGAYWGFGFHEDAVNSALAVANVLARE